MSVKKQSHKTHKKLPIIISIFTILALVAGISCLIIFTPFSVSKISDTDDDSYSDYSGFDEEQDVSGFISDSTSTSSKRSEFTALPSYDGKVRSIACWGDSLIYGVGSDYAYFTDRNGEEFDISNYSVPFGLSQMTGLNAYNMGITGDGSYDIALRAGGIKFYLKDSVNVGYNIPMIINLVDENKKPVYMDDFSGYADVEDEIPGLVYINNEKFLIWGNSTIGNYILRYSEYALEEYVWPFIAVNNYEDEDGNYGEVSTEYYPSAEYNDPNSSDNVTIPANSQVITSAAYDHKEDILILEIGSNGGWDSYDELIAQYDAIIKNSGCKYFLIVGDTDDPGTSIADTKQSPKKPDGSPLGKSETAWETALREAYGRHFINMRLYLIENGMKDVRQRLTMADRLNVKAGFVPESLRADWTHLNSYGYYAESRAIYKAGKDLGYWE